jgi:ABC-type transport auxiliary lipoprotein component
MHRNVPVGEVMDFELNEQTGSVNIRAFVRAPYDRLVVADTDLNTLSAVPDVSIDSELQRFERGEHGLVLHVLIALRRTGQVTPVAIESVELSHASGRGTEEVVAVMDTLLGRLADRLARMVASPPSR